MIHYRSNQTTPTKFFLSLYIIFTKIINSWSKMGFLLLFIIFNSLFSTMATNLETYIVQVESPNNQISTRSTLSTMKFR